MKKRNTLFASAVAAVAVTLGVVTVASASSGKDTKHTIHFLSTGVEHSAQMAGGPPAIGSQDAFNEQLSDDADKVIGHSGGVCTVVSFKDGNGEAVCSITVALPGGDLILAGRQPLNRDPFSLAVVGGTAAYAKASGQADVTVRADRKRDVTVHLNS